MNTNDNKPTANDNKPPKSRPVTKSERKAFERGVNLVPPLLLALSEMDVTILEAYAGTISLNILIQSMMIEQMRQINDKVTMEKCGEILDRFENAIGSMSMQDAQTILAAQTNQIMALCGDDLQMRTKPMIKLVRQMAERFEREVKSTIQ